MPIRVLLADDNSDFRQSLRRLLETERTSAFDVVAEAGSGAEAIEQARRHRPDLAVLDLAMKPVGGLQALREILKQSPDTIVVMLSIHRDRRYVASARAAGAHGYILKDSMDESLPGALRRIAEGEEIFCALAADA